MPQALLDGSTGMMMKSVNKNCRVFELVNRLTGTYWPRLARDSDDTHE